MNYKLTNNNKILCFVMIAIGIISIVASFMTHSHQAWPNLLMNSFYFLAISLGGLFFVAIQYASNAGWAIAIKRIPEAMAAYLPIGGLILLLVLIFGGHHLYHWMHHELFVEFLEDGSRNPEYDPIIAGKAGFLNVPFFYARIVIYLIIWVGLGYLIRKNSLQEDSEGGLMFYKKNVKLSALFLVLFAITSSTAAWDIIMSIDSHWYSTLFGWYTFAGLFISALTMMGLLYVYLKSRGYLPEANENHLHDIGKFMFAFSIFWTYLWFAQFMLIWYANIPEEITYFLERIDHYRWLFWGMFFINFFFPFLIFMTADAKRKANVVAFVGVVLFCGHWIDEFVKVMPGTVGHEWHIGWMEIGTTIGFLGLFLIVTLNALGKASLVSKNHPYLGESLHHQTM